MHMMARKRHGYRKIQLQVVLWEESSKDMHVMSLLYRRPSGKGNRHAELVFEAKKTSGDYHDEMNSERYEHCFFLLSNLKLIFH